MAPQFWKSASQGWMLSRKPANQHQPYLSTHLLSAQEWLWTSANHRAPHFPKHSMRSVTCSACRDLLASTALPYYLSNKFSLVVRFQTLSSVLIVLWQNRQVHTCQVVSGYRENSTGKRSMTGWKAQENLFVGGRFVERLEWFERGPGMRRSRPRAFKGPWGREVALCFGKEEKRRLILQGFGSLDFAPNAVGKQETTQEWTTSSALKRMCTCLHMCIHTHVLKLGPKIL